MVQCSPLREATLSAHRATARFGAYHRAACGGYYTTKRHTQRAAYLSPERLRPFRSGSMFSVPESVAFRQPRSRAVWRVPPRRLRRLLYHKAARSVALLSPKRLRPFRSGSMFSQASKGLRCKALENAVRLLYRIRPREGRAPRHFFAIFCPAPPGWPAAPAPASGRKTPRGHRFSFPPADR